MSKLCHFLLSLHNTLWFGIEACGLCWLHPASHFSIPAAPQAQELMEVCHYHSNATPQLSEKSSISAGHLGSSDKEQVLCVQSRITRLLGEEQKEPNKLHPHTVMKHLPRSVSLGIYPFGIHILHPVKRGPSVPPGAFS